ncbi:MAG: hypothetical protein AAFQ74_11850 [Cyanobacteria bacterium J06623_4]
MKLNHWILFCSGAFSALIASAVLYSPTIAQTDFDDDLPQLSTAIEVPDFEAPVIPANPSTLAADVAQNSAVREPMMTMTVSAAGSITVQLINETSDTLTYQALGDTAPRSLESNSSITLQNLRVPATVTFSFANVNRNRQTGTGLTKAELKSDPGTDMLQLVIQPTTDLDTEVSNLTVESNGNIFVF